MQRLSQVGPRLTCCLPSAPGCSTITRMRSLPSHLRASSAQFWVSVEGVTTRALRTAGRPWQEAGQGRRSSGQQMDARDGGSGVNCGSVRTTALQMASLELMQQGEAVFSAARLSCTESSPAVSAHRGALLEQRPDEGQHLQRLAQPHLILQQKSSISALITAWW